MDALALLCTLHAEGPSTLVRLRASGWSRVEDLLRASGREVAGVLGIPVDRAERLLREARQLADRVQVLEPEEELAAPLAAPLPRVATSAALAPAPPASLGSRRGDPAFAMGPHASATGRRSEPVATEEDEPSIQSEPVEARPVADRAPLASAARPDEPHTAALGTELEHGLLDELDLDLCRALAEAGVRTLEELVAASGLSLSRKVGVPFTRLMELQLRAQRVLDAAPPPARATIPSATRKRAPGPSAPEAPAPRALQYRRFTDRAPARLEVDSERAPARAESPSAESHGAAGPFA